MNIKPMLLRLQHALGETDLLEKMLLIPGQQANAVIHPAKTINLVIGYNGSPNSRSALDLTLWIAHQTRLATQKQVIVHVVYVIDALASTVHEPIDTQLQNAYHHAPSAEVSSFSRTEGATGTTLTQPLRSKGLARSNFRCVNACSVDTDTMTYAELEKADCVLWQARCLAEEWRGSLEAHLRFGSVASEITEMVSSKKADLLFLGCESDQHPLVQQLAPRFPCPVLGIPVQLTVA